MNKHLDFKGKYEFFEGLKHKNTDKLKFLEYFIYPDVLYLKFIIIKDVESALYYQDKIYRANSPY